MAIYVDGTKQTGSGGGGTGGGHIFLDNEGTAMPQRAKAKFEGAYSTDNSTDGITNVAVMRTMNALEYAQLTEAEKQGIIYVDDETTGTDDKFQPVIYSLEEREIGVWTDGKPLYEITADLGASGVQVNSGASVDSTIPISDKETFVYSYGISQTGKNFPVIGAEAGTNYVKMINMGSSNRNVRYFTIRYTKSTDTAGSGQWTPQGVPAVHYSTDEQVIGTWIDGSTIYERTVHFSSLQQLVANGWTNDIMDVSYADLLIDAEVIRTIEAVSTYHYIQTAKNGTTGMFNIFNARNLMVEYDTITLRYTKSS